jgi:hypothetical protein
MNFKSFIFILLFLKSECLFSQSNDEALNENADLLSRYRLSAGYVSLLLDESIFDFHYPFFNFSYRSSGFTKTSSQFQIRFAFEPGVNGLILSNVDYGTDFTLYFVPYAKYGPEMKLGENLFLGGSFGVIIITYVKFSPVPFFGLNNFYLIPLSEKFNLEIEGGFHTTFSPDKLPLLFYITAGITVN